MDKGRKIQKVVRKATFAEAEEKHLRRRIDNNKVLYKKK
jgi:hypothetical protein